MTTDFLRAGFSRFSRVAEMADARDAEGPMKATPSEAYKLSVAEVYDAHSDYVWRCLRSLGVHSEHLEDAVQDVFIVVQQKLETFDGACALRTWLYAIVIHIARKKRSLRARAFQQELEAEGPECTERSAQTREALALLHRVLATLTPAQREVFVLVEIEQMSAPEAAQVLSIPVNTVYARLRLARLAFHKKHQLLSGKKLPTSGGQSG